MTDEKKKLISFILKLIVSVLTAAATAFGVTSCMALTKTITPASDSIVAQFIATDTTTTTSAYPWATDYNEY